METKLTIEQIENLEKNLKACGVPKCNLDEAVYGAIKAIFGGEINIDKECGFVYVIDWKDRYYPTLKNCTKIRFFHKQQAANFIAFLNNFSGNTKEMFGFETPKYVEYVISRVNMGNTRDICVNDSQIELRRCFDFKGWDEVYSLIDSSENNQMEIARFAKWASKNIGHNFAEYIKGIESLLQKLEALDK